MICDQASLLMLTCRTSTHTTLASSTHQQHIASKADKANLFGKTAEEKTRVLEWASFANSTLLPTLAEWCVSKTLFFLTLISPTLLLSRTRQPLCTSTPELT